jgi:CheY-like chemotaxis protein
MAASNRARKVLLIDDEVSGTEVLALFLATEGMTVTVVANGQQALQRLDEAAPDLLIADFMMPGMNGAELVHMVRARPEYEKLPVIFISGAPESAIKAYGVAYDKFLRKPFRLDEFLKIVTDVLDRDQPRREGPEPSSP